MATIDINLPDICCNLDPNTHVVYVSKIGDDANDGLSIDKPKLTITGNADSAQDAAVALQALHGPNVVVHVLDAGVYDVGWSGFPNVILYAPAATLVGNIAMADSATVVADAIYTFAANDGLTVGVRGGQVGTATLVARVIDGRGIAGTVTGTTVVRNNEEDFILFVQCSVLNVPTDGIGFEANNAGVGHIHTHVTDLYLRGNNAIGIRPVPGGNGKIYAIMDHVVQTTGATGTKAIEANSGLVYITGNEINTATAYDISGTADVRLNVQRIVGTRTGTPTLLICEDTFNGKVTGPASAGNNNIALFDQTTGKLIKDSGTALSTVGSNLITQANPAAPRFIQVNADGTVTQITPRQAAQAAGFDFIAATPDQGPFAATWTNIPGLTATLQSGVYYELEVRLMAEISNTSGGINLAFDGVAFTYYAAQYTAIQGAGNVARNVIIAYDDMGVGGDVANAPATGQVYFCVLRATIRPSATGAINARIKRGGSAGNITIRNGSMRIYQP